MSDLSFTHDGKSYVVKTRQVADGAVSEVLKDDGKPTGYSVSATHEILSDMKASGHGDPLRRLGENAMDAFISRN